MINSSISDDLKDNIGGQRSKFDVIATILNVCLEQVLKNHIIGKGNFSDAMVNHYLSILLYHSLLKATKDSSGRTNYETTEKGKQFLHYYKDMQALFLPGRLNAGKSRAETISQEGSARGHQNATSNTPSNLDDKGSLAKRILIVDDENDITSAMKIGLEDSGFKVDSYNDPLAAITNYEPGTYDLLIVDVKMPYMGGFELYRRIREVDDEAKVCFLTAFEMYLEEFKRVFPSMDVKHFIQKPVAMPDLIEHVHKLTEMV